MSEIVRNIDVHEQSNNDQAMNLVPLVSFDQNGDIPLQEASKSTTIPVRQQRRIKSCQFCFQSLFFRMGSIVFVIIYMIFGGLLFYSIESRYEPEKQQRIKSKRLDGIQQIRNVITEEFNWMLNQSFELHYAHWRGMLSRLDGYDQTGWRVQFSSQRFEQLIHYELAHMQADEEKFFDKDDRRTDAVFDQKWTYSIAMLYSATVITTVGYGNITPKSILGKLMTCLYAVIGIPIMIMYVTNTGDLLAFLFIKYYNMITNYLQRKFQHKTHLENEHHHVPMPIVISMLILYILSGGILFNRWEGWSLIDSMYFSFITFTTIGLGDLVPGQGTLTDNKNGKSILCALYLLHGLVLTTMCFKLIQDDLYLIKQKLITYLGFDTYQKRYLVYNYHEQGLYT